MARISASEAAILQLDQPENGCREVLGLGLPATKTVRPITSVILILHVEWRLSPSTNADAANSDFERHSVAVIFTSILNTFLTWSLSSSKDDSAPLSQITPSV